MTDRLLALNIIYFFSRTTGPISIKLGTTYLEQLFGKYIDEFLAGCLNFRCNGLFEIEWVSHKIFIIFFVPFEGGITFHLNIIKEGSVPI